jgi:putative transcriptional regulator
MKNNSKILIAEPFLGDPNFERSIILLCEDNEDGAFGFVLNQPTEVKVEELHEKLTFFQQEVLIGGPVANDSLNFIYKGEPLIEDSLELGDGVYLGGNFEQLIEFSEQGILNQNNFKFFLGYSGWTAGQLEKEINNNTWIFGQSNLNSIFDMSPENMWRNILKDMGPKYKMYSNYPIDPRLN